jgi:hypothetical protein
MSRVLIDALFDFLNVKGIEFKGLKGWACNNEINSTNWRWLMSVVI